MEKEIRKKAAEKMEHTMDALKKEFGSVRTGRASLSILDGIKVDYYGTPTPLQQVSSLSIPESRQIMIQPWEPKMMTEIEKAIMKSDLGLTPINDGKVIRINIPALTEERRLQLVKTTKKLAEDAKIAIRNIRRDTNDAIKKLEKDKHISEDETKKSLDEMQKLTDSFIKKIDELTVHKDKEIMEV